MLLYPSLVVVVVVVVFVVVDMSAVSPPKYPLSESRVLNCANSSYLFSIYNKSMY